ncbi:Ycf48-like protein [Salinivirga cyanobacteriivorans]|uniref:Ycf48-like protein n=1 Tax=Salinivirga cyanobacteriivorans TaxID=1307839 RepID=A0A0S2I0X9_9BACT|nr:T9SS type A sorting domain-containing protein [Salinivirga cyanobacteriivorans]ALO15949.1 Ycf48-like protein [Salinivirga cyanobacteriivorans]
MRTFILFLLLFLFARPLFSQDFWEEIPLPDNVQVNDIYGINENITMICGSAGLYTTYDGAETWQHEIESPSLVYLMTYKNTYYAVTRGIIYRRIGIEGEWEQINNRGHTSDFFCFINDTIIFSGGFQSISKSVDGGCTWDEIYEGGLNESFQSIAQHPSGILFAGSLSYDAYTISGLYKSEDEGETWDKFALEYFSNDIIRIGSSGELYVGCYNKMYAFEGGVFKSTDLGATWDTLRDDLSVTGLVVTPGDTIYAASHGFELTTPGVLMSPDAGDTWQDVTNGIEYPAIYKLELGKDGHLYAVSDGSQDKIYRSIDAVTVHNSHNSDFSVDQPLIYPNPAHDRINIKLNSNISISELLIYKINGQQVLSKSLNQDLNSIDVSALPGGTYIIRIRNSSTTFNQLFIKH